MVDFTTIQVPGDNANVQDQNNQSPGPAGQSNGDFTNVKMPVDIESTKPNALGAGAWQGLKQDYRGIVQAGHLIGEKVGLLPEGSTAEYTKKMDEIMSQEHKQLQAEYADSPMTLEIGKYLGQVAPYLALGAQGMVANMALWGGVGATQYVPEGGSRAANTAIGAGLGAAGSLIGKALNMSSSIANKLMPSSPKAARDVLSVTTKAADGKQAAAQKVGTFLTPGEATGSKVLQASEGRIQPGTSILKDLEAKLGDRASTVRGSVKKVINDILPQGSEKAKETVKVLYDSAKGVKVPESEFKGLMQNPIIANAADKAAHDPMFRMDQVEAGSVGHLDILKKYIQSHIAENVTKGIKAEANGNLMDAVKQITKVADSASPEYQLGRGLSQQVHIQDHLLQKIDKLKVGQDGEPTLKAVYDGLFSTQAKVKSFLKDLKVAGGDTEQAKAVITTLRAINNSPIERLLTKDPEVAGIGKVGSSATGVALEKIKGMLSGSYNKTLVNLMTNPNWKEAATKLAGQKTLPEKLAMLAGILKTNKAAIVVPATSHTPTAAGMLMEQNDQPESSPQDGSDNSQSGQNE